MRPKSPIRNFQCPIKYFYWRLEIPKFQMSNLSGSLLFVDGACRRQKHPVVEVSEIRRRAEIFRKLGSGHQWDFGCFSSPGLGEGLRIDDSDLRFDCAVVQPPPPLDNLHLVAVGPAAVGIAGRNPGPIIITI